MGKTKFRKGDLVWISHPEDVYALATVVEKFKRGEEGKVKSVESGEVITLSTKITKKLIKADKKIYEEHKNLTSLTELSEQSILFSLKKRFQEDNIYTSIGPILVSINPFKELPYYTQDVLEQYMEGTATLSSAPHIYAVAANCYKQLVGNKKNQACIVTGESGAGKTEATKLIMQFLTEKSSSGDIARKEKSYDFQKKILEMSPLLEAFGNARTGRNDNSSRFGKLTQLYFDSVKGTICGVGIVDYLLERSRIVQQLEGERNYHVFYQMLTDERIRTDFQLQYPEKYYYLTQSGNPANVVVKSLNDADDFKDTKQAMDVLGISVEDQTNIWRTLCGILNLGNVSFSSSGEKDPASIKDRSSVQLAARLLGIDENELSEGLLRTRMEIRGETTFKDHNLQKATDARDALAKFLYGALFSYLIDEINGVLKSTASAKNISTINVLDIFGFEQFQVNSFEQLCINYCNEKLQVHFIENVFKVEQQSYAKEGINVKKIEFEDNSEVISIIEDRGKGIYALLDEQNRLPTGSDELFLKKVLSASKGYKNLYPPPVKVTGKNPFMRLNFNIRHFAGEVSYHVAHFLEKNSDMLLPSVQDLLATTKNKYTQMLFVRYIQSGKGSKSLGLKFKQQLSELMKVLNDSEPHFVRTIKPNPEKVKEKINAEMVLQQIRCAGLTGVCEIHKNGYPVKFSFKEFQHRYNPVINHAASNYNQLTQLLQEAGLFPEGEWQIGKTQIFMRNGVHEDLETAREDKLAGYAIKIQKHIRGYLAKKQFLKLKAVLKDLEDAVKHRDLARMKEGLANVSKFSKRGAFSHIVSLAKATVSEIETAEKTLKDLREALGKKDILTAQSLLNSVEAMKLENVRGQSVIIDARKFLRQQQSKRVEPVVETEDIFAYIEKMWAKMGSALGISEKDLELIASTIQKTQGKSDSKNAEVMEELKKLQDFATLQLEIQEFVQLALEEENEEDLAQALQFVQQFKLQTADAKKVIELMLANENKAQENMLTASRRVNTNKNELNPMQQNLMKMSIRVPSTKGGIMPTNFFNTRGLSAVTDLSASIKRAKGKHSSMNLFSSYKNIKARNKGMSQRAARVSAKVEAAQLQGILRNEAMDLKLEDFYQIRTDDDFFASSRMIMPEPIMKYTGKALQKSITKLSGSLNKEALQVSKSILQYTGDVTFQYPSSAAQKVIQVALQNSLLINEVYLQILKNLNGNTKPTSEDRSWILLILITQLVPPTKELEPYVISFLSKSSSNPLVIGNYARLCLAQLERTLDVGTTETVPEIDMISAYSTRPALLLSIETTTPIYSAKRGEKQNIVIDMPCYPDTEVETIVDAVCEVAGYDPAEYPLYGLFVTGSNVVTENQLATRLKRFYEKWDPSKLEHVDYFATLYKEKEEELFSQLVSKYGPEPPPPPKNYNPKSVAMQREDVADENLFYPIPWWSYPGDIFLKLSFRGAEPTFSLKRKIITRQEKPSGDLIEQLRQLISRGEMAIPDYEDVTKLAAIAYCLKSRGNLESEQDILEIGLDYFLPEIWLNEQSKQETARDIFTLCRPLLSYRPKQLYEEFIDICKAAEGYGVWFYPVTEVTSVSPSKGETRNKLDYVGVSIEGLHLFDATRTETLQLFPHTTIKEYGANNDSIWFDFRGPDGKAGPQAEFFTKLPWEIYSGVQGYIEVLQKMKEGTMEAPSTNFDRGSVFRFGAY